MSRFDRALDELRREYVRCDQERQANAEAAADRERELRYLRAENRRLQARVDSLEQDVARLTAKLGAPERDAGEGRPELGLNIEVLEGSG